jgi:hypothetical protein
MSLQRRLTLYLFGLIIGGFVAYNFYGERLTGGEWLPEHKVKQRLSSTLIKARPEADTQLEGWPADLAAVRKAIPTATVSFKESIRSGDSIYYALTGEVNGRAARFVVVGLRDFDRDSTATLWELERP